MVDEHGPPRLIDAIHRSDNDTRHGSHGQLDEELVVIEPGIGSGVREEEHDLALRQT